MSMAVSISTPAEVFLRAAGPLESFARNGRTMVWLTPALQLVGSHGSLTGFARTYRFRGEPVYRGWHSHHIVEVRHLQNLRIAHHLPKRDDLPCVLLPASAHTRRLGSLLRGLDTQRLSRPELVAAYAEAYDNLGNYTGGGRRPIVRELVAVVRRLLSTR